MHLCERCVSWLGISGNRSQRRAGHRLIAQGAESHSWGGSARLWEELLDKFAQARLTNERELQIRAAEVGMSAYRQTAELWSSQQRGQHMVYWKIAINFALN